MMTKPTAAVVEYIRARLLAECAARGRVSQIAREMGFPSAHISAILDGSRSVDAQFAGAVARHWGLAGNELEQLAAALKKPELGAGSKARGVAAAGAAVALPNLEATLSWCRGTYPDEFLEAYAQRARGITGDRPRRVWLNDIEASLWHWMRSARDRALGLPDEDNLSGPALTGPVPRRHRRRNAAPDTGGPSERQGGGARSEERERMMAHEASGIRKNVAGQRRGQGGRSG